MTADVGFLIGYGGWCKLRHRHGSGSGSKSGGTTGAEFVVPITGGSYSRGLSVPTMASYDVKLDDENRTMYRIGSGVYAYSGSLNFEMSQDLMSNLFSKSEFYHRREFLDITFCDGEGMIEIPGCVWSSFSISADAGNLVTGSLSFSSCNGYEEEIEVKAPLPLGTRDLPVLEPYWRYGNEGVQSFSLSISRNVQPVYLNERHWIGPTYLRVGTMEASIQVTCWKRWIELSERKLYLGDSVIQFPEAMFQSERGYQFTGASGESSKSYTWNAAGNTVVENLFNIQSR